MKEKLLALAAQYDIPLTAAGAAALCGYLERLLETNRAMNLTAITDPDEALCKHLLDCLVAAALPEMAGRVADVGAGAGFPSVVIKALRPECEVTALDATGKKLDFVASASAACGLACRTAHIRAEDAGRDPGFRERFDTVAARAVAALPVLCEYCLPLVRVGGHFIAMKGPGAEQECAQASAALQALGGELLRAQTVTLPDGSQRVNLVIKKARPTPKSYPRRQKDIKARPLG